VRSPMNAFRRCPRLDARSTRGWRPIVRDRVKNRYAHGDDGTLARRMVIAEASASRSVGALRSATARREHVEAARHSSRA